MIARAVPLVLCAVAGEAVASEPDAARPLQLMLADQQPGQGQGDDFDLLPPEKPPDAAAVARQAELSSALRRRREMLRLHQFGGFATLATMAATAVVGQLNYMDKYGGGGDTGRYRFTHQVLAYTTSGVFAATGLLALFAPSPFEKQLRLDTATLHKTAMIVATAGMVAQVVLGIVTAHNEGSVAQRDYALAHQIIGYTTLAATGAGFTVLLFP